MAISKEQRLANIHSECLREFDNIQTALREERLQCVQDRRFYSIAGAQWEGPLGEQFENKPKFEVNKIHLSVIRIINEYRNNRVTVDYQAKDGGEDKLADICDGLYRADEMDSCANEAYDNAFEEAVGGGFGAWRLTAQYEDEEDDENEKQRIRIEPIYDADTSVFFDLNAKRQDKSDAKSCYVLYAMTPEQYMEEYDEDPASWPKDVQEYEFDWNTPDVVYVAEVYRVEEYRETIRIFETLSGEEERYSRTDFAENPELEDELAAVGTLELRQKRVKKKRVHKYIMSGNSILEDLGYVAGKHIPIVPIYGKRWFVDNIERCMGHVRLVKDSQRIKNMQLSKLGEISALSSLEKPILTPEQVAGHQMMWSEDNLKDYPYLLLNPITDQNGNEVPQGPIGYTKPPAVPPAMAALLQITEQDMSDIMGNQQAGEEMNPNMSGKAVELIQQRLDMQTFIYMSNFSKGMKRAGEIWLSMARDLYVEDGRKMKIIGDDDSPDTIELMKPAITPEGGLEHENDLTQATFDVVAEVGPSSTSKKAATVRALTGMMTITQDPATLSVLSAMAMMNLEGEGLGDAKQYFRKQLITMGVVTPTDKEREEMAAEAAGQQEDPNSVALRAMAEEAQAKAAKARADVVKTIADAELTEARTTETEAKTMETIAKIDQTDERINMDAIRMMPNMTGR